MSVATAPGPTSPLVLALADPGFYPHRPARVELRETHISWVFLAGELVYKVKKPIVLPFLDYGTLERRRLMCEEEVRLGRRLAPDLYLGVRSLVPADGGYALAGPDDPRAIEYAVEQHRFPEERTLRRLLDTGQVTDDEVRRVGTRLAEFHATAAHAPAGSFGPSAVAAAVDENFETLLEIAALDDGDALAAAHRFAIAFIHARRDALARRQSAGHVRECHGDLRAEHVILDAGIAIFDPVEFDPALRFIDVSADLAFLVMDLEAAGRTDLARELVAAYRRAGGDCGQEELLYFYATYRAWVRAKVAFVRAGELAATDPLREVAVSEGRELAALGRRLAWRARTPLSLVVCGGSASGKTYLAEELARRSGLPHLGSDTLRKELAGLQPTARASEREYSEDASVRTYAELGARARAAVQEAGGVIVDATFRRRTHRDAFARGYGDEVPPPHFVECRAPAAVLAQRASARMRDGRRISDATVEIAERQRLEFQPLDEVPPRRHAVLRTDRPVEEIAEQVELALDGRLHRPT